MNKIKLTTKKIIFSFYLFVIILSALALLCNTLFLYKNFYKTITRSEKIKILQKKVMIESIDIKKFDSITKKIKEKTSRRELKNIKNPFD